MHNHVYSALQHLYLVTFPCGDSKFFIITLSELKVHACNTCLWWHISAIICQMLDLYVILSDLNVDLSDLYVELSFIHLFEIKS